MAKDSSQLAREYIDGTLKARASLGRSAKPSKAAYARAVRSAKLAMDDLISLARENDERVPSAQPKPKSARPGNTSRADVPHS